MAKRVLIFLHILSILILTVLTQVGGIIYLLIWLFSLKFKFSRLKSTLLFLLVYLMTSFFILPVVAPWFGRQALPMHGKLRPLTLITCILNRHYVTSDLKQQLVEASEVISDKYEGTDLIYLDANFPLLKVSRFFLI